MTEYYLNNPENRHLETADFSNAEHLLVCGDIHGEFRTLVFTICSQCKISNAVVIVAGDCGLGFHYPKYYENELRHCGQQLRKHNVTVVLLRGNHDDPAWFTAQRKAADGFLIIPDYTVVRCCGHNVLCVGGAISIDRRVRKNWQAADGHTYYWPDEPPFYSPALLDELQQQQIPIDTVVTHTAPSFCVPTDKNGIESWLARDNALFIDCEMERTTIDKIYERLLADKHPLRQWFYGHFHLHNEATIDGIDFTALDIMQIRKVNTL